VLDPTQYKYFAGLAGEQPLWAAGEKSGVLVVPTPVGELSVMWDEYLQRWIMTYLDDQADQLVIREAKELWGSWGPALTLVSSGIILPCTAPFYTPGMWKTTERPSISPCHSGAPIQCI
jgi:hypothetical protein